VRTVIMLEEQKPRYEEKHCVYHKTTLQVMLMVAIGEEFRVLHLILELTMRIYKLSMGENILRK
jgi:hypothetical protein